MPMRYVDRQSTTYRSYHKLRRDRTLKRLERSLTRCPECLTYQHSKTKRFVCPKCGYKA